jgi:hypothetical protein
MGFGQHHLISFYFWIFENLLWTCVLEQASREYKFHNFWTYGSKVMGKQKIYEKSGRAGMCWSQPARVDHMCKKMWAGGRRRISQGGSLRHPRWKGGWLAISCRPLTTIWQITGCSSTGPPSLFLFLLGVIRKFGDGPGILGEWLYGTPISWTLPLQLGGWNLPFLMKLGNFIFCQFFA